MPQKILIVDESSDTRVLWRSWLQDAYEIHELGSCRALQTHLDAPVNPPDVVLIDLQLPDGRGETAIPPLLKKWPKARVMVLTNLTDNPERITEAVKLGANAVHKKPAVREELYDYVDELLEEDITLTQAVAPVCPERSPGGHHKISAAMTVVMTEVEKVARTGETVLVIGESGTGKEVTARQIHTMSARKGKFVAVNCSAIPETLIEAELFGAKKGSYTGCSQDRTGIFKQADGGTILLDEIGDMPFDMQAKLLRVLQEHEVRPVGDVRTYPLSCRVIAATNVDLRQAVRDRKFREDLFWRLAVVTLDLPPLRRRRTEIVPLAERFLREYAEKNGLKPRGFTREAERKLLAYLWPGNIRELNTVIRRAALRADDVLVEEKHIDFASDGGWKNSVENMRRQRVINTLNQCAFNKTRAAEALGVARSTLYLWLQQLEITT